MIMLVFFYKYYSKINDFEITANEFQGLIFSSIYLNFDENMYNFK